MNKAVPEQHGSFQGEALSGFDGGVWEWDIVTGKIVCSAAWANILGYPLEELPNTADAFWNIVFSEDLPYIKDHLTTYFSGERTQCEMRFRMICNDKTLIWVQAKGFVTARDNTGRPVRFLGALENITHHSESLRRLEKQLSDVMESLESNHLSMESAAIQHTLEMKAQNALLSMISQISRNLVSVQSNKSFESQVQDCLRLLGENSGNNRVYIWKDYTDETGVNRCSQLYEWTHNALPTRNHAQVEGISYEAMPTILSAIQDGLCLNCTVDAFSVTEQEFLRPQGIKSILIAPIAINGRCWGFIGVDNCENNQLFPHTEETMLLISGSLLASTIEKMNTEAALREMEERAQIMLNATPLCCNLWTPEYHNMSCNDEAVRLFQLSSQQEYLERFYELSPEYQPDGTRSDELAIRHITKAFDEGYDRFEWLHQKLDGTPVPAEITLVRIKYRDSFIVAGYTRDLREEKAMLAELKNKEALRRARDEALLTSKAKSNFLANMSHEIRTPMNAISGFAEIIVRECGSDAVRDYAIGIRNACNNLINIINDILDISKIESGKLEIYNAPYEFASLLNDVITISKMRLGSRPLRFVTNIDSHLPARLVGDEVRIRQILLNLLSNAIKYTQEGSIVLQVSGTIDDDCVMLGFSVKDSGIGIKAEDVSRLFEEFERINTTKVRNIEGTGLGLAISKQLCEKMGGHINVQSTYGSGSEFTVHIPQKCFDHERLAQVHESRRVLLYEPRKQYRLSIARSIKNLDCTCVVCQHQTELRNCLLDSPFDFLLTPAIHLKDVQCALSETHHALKVAAYADYGETAIDKNIYTLMSPISCLQLSVLLNGHQTEDSKSQNRKSVERFVAPSARVLVVDDNSVNLQVVQGLMEPYHFMIDTAVNGVEAVNMVQSTEYDLVFMDHMMPEMDGVDATLAIRGLEGDSYRDLKIIALTANALVGTRDMFLRNGMNDFLSKPIELNKLTQILLKWLPKSKVQPVVSATDSGKEEEPSILQIDGIDIKKGLLFVSGKEENYLRILDAYYADCSQKCISLPQHLANNDIAAFQIEIHALKSTSASVGALQLSLFAEKLESAAHQKDITYISNQINTFLSALQAVMDGIRPHISKLSGKPAKTKSHAAGSPGYLANALDLLQHGAEYFEINVLEETWKGLQDFRWPVEIEKEIASVQAYLKVFDYAGILDCVDRLKHCRCE